MSDAADECYIERKMTPNHRKNATMVSPHSSGSSTVRPADPQLLPLNVASCDPSGRCQCGDGASINAPSSSFTLKDSINKAHHKQLYFWNTHFSAKLVPSIARILRDEGPAGTVRILSCTGLVAEAIYTILQSSARVSMLVLSGLSTQDSGTTMRALLQFIEGWSTEHDTAVSFAPVCVLCRPYPSLRTLRILETTFGGAGNVAAAADDDDSSSLFDFLGRPSCGIRELDLTKSKLSRGAVRSLAAALSRNATIRILKLNHVQFMVGGNPAPESDLDVDLSRNSEHSRGAFESSQSTSPSSCPLATILKACIVQPNSRVSGRLKELHMSHAVTRGTDAMMALCQLLPSLETLDISGSRWSTTRNSSGLPMTTSLSDVMSILFYTLTRTNVKTSLDGTFRLKQLVLTGLPLSESDMSQLCRALEHPVAGPLQQLESLELQNCQLTEPAMLAMMQSMPRWSTSLRRLDLAGNFLRPAAVDRLLQAVEQNYTLHDLGRPLLLRDATQQRQHALLEFYLDCNWAGRRLFRRCPKNNDARDHHDQHGAWVPPKVLPGLWPHVLERINRKPVRRTRQHYSHDGPGRRESLLFSMLRGPALLESH